MRKTKICILMVMLVLQTLSMSVWTRDIHAAPSGGGSGTSTDPYIILTAQDLTDLQSNLSAHYRLGADINLAGYDFDGSGPDTGGWMPIGVFGTPFTGTLDGNGYAIRNMTVNRPTIRVGLFGLTGTNAQLINIRLLDINVIGNGELGGGLVGNLVSGTIRSSIVTGRISMSGSDAPAGGLVGVNAGGTIVNSYAVVHVGGGASRHGGLVGTNAGTIRNSYAAGNVNGDQEIGGLVGYHNSGTIENSYAVGHVNGSSGVGGLVGRNGTANTFPSSYWNMETSGQLSSYDGTGVTMNGMKDTNTFAGWDTSIWGFRNGETYPYLLASKLGIVVNPLAEATYSLYPGQDALSVTGNVYHEMNGEQVTVKYDIRNDSNVTVISTTFNVSAADGSTQAINRRLPLAGLNNGNYSLIVTASDIHNIVVGAMLAFKVDTAIMPPPSVSFGTNGNESWSQSASTKVTVSNSGGGVNASTLQYVWSTERSTPIAGWNAFMSGDTLTKSGAEGDWYLHIQAKDIGGITANVVSDRFRLDNTNPTISFGTSGSETWGQSASTAVTVADNVSGVDATTQKEYAWSSDTAPPASGWASFASGDTLTKSGVDGDWYLHIQASDAAGNTMNTVSNRFRLDASAAELSGLSLSEGELSPAFAGSTYSYTARVSDSISFITVMPDTADTTDTITLSANGGSSQTVTSGTSSGQQALREGANTISVSVAALNGTQKSYTVTVNRDSQSSDNQMPATDLAPGPVDFGLITDSSGAVKLIAEPSLIEKFTRPDGTVIEVVNLQHEMLAQALELLKVAGKPVLTIEINDTGQAVEVPIPAGWIATVASSVSNAIIDVKLNGSSFQLVISVLDLEGVAAQLGVELKDLKVNVIMERVGGQIQNELDQIAASYGGKLIGSAIDYKISVEVNGLSVEVRDFGGTYMSRAIVLDSDAAAKRFTAIIYDPITRTLSFVPSVLAVRVDGKREIAMSVPHNSIYAIMEAGSKTFSDLDGHWAKADVELLASKLIIQGVTDGRFDPDADVTRAEFTALLVRALGLSMNTNATSSVFTDAAADEWYASAVQSAVHAGLVSGTAPEIFAPDEPITREQMAVMIANALTTVAEHVSPSNHVSGRLSKFTDRESISTWALASVDQAEAAGIITGMTDDTFAPSEHATRAQASVMLKRLLQHVQFID